MRLIDRLTPATPCQLQALLHGLRLRATPWHLAPRRPRRCAPAVSRLRVRAVPRWPAGHLGARPVRLVRLRLPDPREMEERVIQRADSLPASAQAALERLLDGNRRFVQNVRSLEPMLGQARRGELVAAQTPFAIVLSCSDSRAPAELIFDQGLGDLFVIRVAGNIIAPSLVGSVEFAAATFGTPLAMVMGHSRCGAVAATLDAIQGRGGATTENIGDIVERIRPAVEPLARDDGPRDELLARCVEANVRRAVEQLRGASALLQERIRRDELALVGAVYSLESGAVSLLGDEG